MCLTVTQGHNAVIAVRLEPTTPRSVVKHSTTEPLRGKDLNKMLYFVGPLLTTLSGSIQVVGLKIVCIYLPSLCVREAKGAKG